MYQLVLTHDATVNLIAVHTHIFHANRKAGDQLAFGQLAMVLDMQQHYFRAGYGTRVVECPA